eukprot:Nk52_evm3s401 gene=Nk52_evmTU3s401
MDPDSDPQHRALLGPQARHLLDYYHTYQDPYRAQAARWEALVKKRLQDLKHKQKDPSYNNNGNIKQAESFRVSWPLLSLALRQIAAAQSLLATSDHELGERLYWTCSSASTRGPTGFRLVGDESLLARLSSTGPSARSSIEGLFPIFRGYSSFRAAWDALQFHANVLQREVLRSRPVASDQDGLRDIETVAQQLGQRDDMNSGDYAYGDKDPLPGYQQIDVGLWKSANDAMKKELRKQLFQNNLGVRRRRRGRQSEREMRSESPVRGDEMGASEEDMETRMRGKRNDSRRRKKREGPNESGDEYVDQDTSEAYQLLDAFLKFNNLANSREVFDSLNRTITGDGLGDLEQSILNEEVHNLKVELLKLDLIRRRTELLFGFSFAGSDSGNNTRITEANYGKGSDSFASKQFERKLNFLNALKSPEQGQSLTDLLHDADPPEMHSSNGEDKKNKGIPSDPMQVFRQLFMSSQDGAGFDPYQPSSLFRITEWDIKLYWRLKAFEKAGENISGVKKMHEQDPIYINRGLMLQTSFDLISQAFYLLSVWKHLNWERLCGDVSKREKTPLDKDKENTANTTEDAGADTNTSTANAAGNSAGDEGDGNEEDIAVSTGMGGDTNGGGQVDEGGRKRRRGRRGDKEISLTGKTHPFLGTALPRNLFFQWITAQEYPRHVPHTSSSSSSSRVTPPERLQCNAEGNRVHHLDDARDLGEMIGQCILKYQTVNGIETR